MILCWTQYIRCSSSGDRTVAVTRWNSTDVEDCRLVACIQAKASSSLLSSHCYLLHIISMIFSYLIWFYLSLVLSISTNLILFQIRADRTTLCNLMLLSYFLKGSLLLLIKFVFCVNYYNLNTYNNKCRVIVFYV